MEFLLFSQVYLYHDVSKISDLSGNINSALGHKKMAFLKTRYRVKIFRNLFCNDMQHQRCVASSHFYALLLCNGGRRQNTFSVNDIICIFLRMRTHAHKCKCKTRFFLYAPSFVYIITSCPRHLIGQDFYTVMVILPSVAAMVCSSQPLTLCFNVFVWVEIFFKTVLERIGFKEKKES